LYGPQKHSSDFAKEFGVTDKSADELRRLAADIGFENAAPDVLDQLPLAAATARRHKSALQAFALAPGDEPAVVFIAGQVGEK
jgi:hypothetical protein